MNAKKATVIVEKIESGADLQEAIDFIDAHFKKPTHKLFLAGLIQQKAIHIYAAKEDGEIVGLRSFSRVVAPWDGMRMGYALDLDLSNSYDINPDLS